jgi:hypothetical protein
VAGRRRYGLVASSANDARRPITERKDCGHGDRPAHPGRGEQFPEGAPMQQLLAATLLSLDGARGHCAQPAHDRAPDAVLPCGRSIARRRPRHGGPAAGSRGRHDRVVRGFALAVAFCRRRVGPRLLVAVDVSAGAGLMAFGGLLGYRSLRGRRGLSGQACEFPAQRYSGRRDNALSASGETVSLR